MTQALIRAAVCAHTSAAMHALTQLTQAGASVSSEPKRWHARAAASTQHNKKTVRAKAEGQRGLGALVFSPSFFFWGRRRSDAGRLAF